DDPGHDGEQPERGGQAIAPAHGAERLPGPVDAGAPGGAVAERWEEVAPVLDHHPATEDGQSGDQVQRRAQTRAGGAPRGRQQAQAPETPGHPAAAPAACPPPAPRSATSAGAHPRTGAALTERLIQLGHSPDPDDAFMFYALAEGRIDTGEFRFVHLLRDIETLNRWATEGRLEITALSVHASAYLTHRSPLWPPGAPAWTRSG